MDCLSASSVCKYFDAVTGGRDPPLCRELLELEPPRCSSPSVPVGVVAPPRSLFTSEITETCADSGVLGERPTSGVPPGERPAESGVRGDRIDILPMPEPPALLS